MHYLMFDREEVAEGVCTLEAMVSTQGDRHQAVMTEVQRVLDWAWQHFPHTHGPLDEGMDWDHDLQVVVEDGQWHTCTLTLAANRTFVEAFLSEFGQPAA